jgi:predicted SAM-dependent methyltransferase
MKLVIGTRRWLGPEWTHVDIDPRPLLDPDGGLHPVDVVGDARAVPLPDGCAEYVYTQECLEHFPWRETRDVMAEWVRLLAVGGTLRVEVPDFLLACNQVLSNDTEYMDQAIQQIIFGGQENEFDFHYTGLTPRILTRHMTELGLDVKHIARGDEVGYLQVDGRKT